MAKSKIFLLGVGAQKCGTSWLSKYLASFKNTNFGCSKEYHVWDAIMETPLNYPFKVNISDLKSKNQTYEILRYAMQNFEGVYEGYFSNLCSANINVTGDITPTYALLKKNSLNIIKRRLESAGFDIKVIFIMRDPFERILSQARMHVNKRRTKYSAERLVRDSLENDEIWHGMNVRTQYQNTIRNLESVFKGIYHNLNQICKQCKLTKIKQLNNMLLKYDKNFLLNLKQANCSVFNIHKKCINYIN